MLVVVIVKVLNVILGIFLKYYLGTTGIFIAGAVGILSDVLIVLVKAVKEGKLSKHTVYAFLSKKLSRKE